MNDERFQEDKPLPAEFEMTLHDDEEAIFEAVKIDPNNDELRAIYADWLESREDIRSEYLRFEIEIHNSDDPSAEHVRRLAELAEQISQEWRIEVLRGPVRSCLESCGRHWFEFEKLDGYLKQRLCVECSRPVRACSTASEVELFESIPRALIVADYAYVGRS